MGLFGKKKEKKDDVLSIINEFTIEYPLLLELKKNTIDKVMTVSKYDLKAIENMLKYVEYQELPLLSNIKDLLNRQIFLMNKVLPKGSTIQQKDIVKLASPAYYFFVRKINKKLKTIIKDTKLQKKLLAKCVDNETTEHIKNIHSLYEATLHDLHTIDNFIYQFERRLMVDLTNIQYKRPKEATEIIDFLKNNYGKKSQPTFLSKPIIKIAAFFVLGAIFINAAPGLVKEVHAGDIINDSTLKYELTKNWNIDIEFGYEHEERGESYRPIATNIGDTIVGEIGIDNGNLGEHFFLTNSQQLKHNLHDEGQDYKKFFDDKGNPDADKIADAIGADIRTVQSMIETDTKMLHSLIDAVSETSIGGNYSFVKGINEDRALFCFESVLDGLTLEGVRTVPELVSFLESKGITKDQELLLISALIGHSAEKISYKTQAQGKAIESDKMLQIFADSLITKKAIKSGDCVQFSNFVSKFLEETGNFETATTTTMDDAAHRISLAYSSDSDMYYIIDYGQVYQGENPKAIKAKYLAERGLADFAETLFSTDGKAIGIIQTAAEEKVSESASSLGAFNPHQYIRDVRTDLSKDSIYYSYDDKLSIGLTCTNETRNINLSKGWLLVDVGMQSISEKHKAFDSVMKNIGVTIRNDMGGSCKLNYMDLEYPGTGKKSAMFSLSAGFEGEKTYKLGDKTELKLLGAIQSMLLFNQSVEEGLFDLGITSISDVGVNGFLNTIFAYELGSNDEIYFILGAGIEELTGLGQGYGIGFLPIYEAGFGSKLEIKGTKVVLEGVTVEKESSSAIKLKAGVSGKGFEAYADYMKQRSRSAFIENKEEVGLSLIGKSKKGSVELEGSYGEEKWGKGPAKPEFKAGFKVKLDILSF